MSADEAELARALERLDALEQAELARLQADVVSATSAADNVDVQELIKLAERQFYSDELSQAMATVTKIQVITMSRALATGTGPASAPDVTTDAKLMLKYRDVAGQLAAKHESELNSAPENVNPLHGTRRQALLAIQVLQGPTAAWQKFKARRQADLRSMAQLAPRTAESLTALHKILLAMISHDKVVLDTTRGEQEVWCFAPAIPLHRLLEELYLDTYITSVGGYLAYLAAAPGESEPLSVPSPESVSRPGSGDTLKALALAVAEIQLFAKKLRELWPLHSASMIGVNWVPHCSELLQPHRAGVATMFAATAQQIVTDFHDHLRRYKCVLCARWLDHQPESAVTDSSITVSIAAVSLGKLLRTLGGLCKAPAATKPPSDDTPAVLQPPLNTSRTTDSLLAEAGSYFSDDADTQSLLDCCALAILPHVREIVSTMASLHYAEPPSPVAIETEHGSAVSLPWRQQHIAICNSLKMLSVAWMQVATSSASSEQMASAQAPPAFKVGQCLHDGLAACLHAAVSAVVDPCKTMILSDIGARQWNGSHAYFKNTRVSPGIQMWMLTVRATLHDSVACSSRLPAQHTASTHVGNELVAAVLEQTLAPLAAFYSSVHPSRARIQQFQNDVVHLVAFTLSMRKFVPEAPRLRLEQLCARLLAIVTLVTGPIELVQEFMHSVAADKVEVLPQASKVGIPQLGAIANSVATESKGSDEPDCAWIPTSHKVPLSRHGFMTEGVAQFTALCEKQTFLWASSEEFNPLVEVTVFGHTNSERSLLDIDGIDWASNLHPCPVELESALVWVQRRHEISTWEFPKLTAEETEAGKALAEVVEAAKARFDSR